MKLLWTNGFVLMLPFQHFYLNVTVSILLTKYEYDVHNFNPGICGEFIYTTLYIR